jgi:riboflavin synthase
MFTGIIRHQGELAANEARGGDRRLTVRVPEAARSELAPGDSIAVNGVCLTVADLAQGSFAADVSQETLGVTTLGTLGTGTRVNLEPALAVGDRLGGHFVSGHVDGTGTVRSVTRDARSLRVEIALPAALERYVSRKGSICIDGVSLTINAVSGAAVFLNIIPHTTEVTNIGGYAAGTRVNVEVDMLARYLEGLLRGNDTGITEEFLKAHGYA